MMQALQTKCLLKYEAVMELAEAHFDCKFERMPIIFSNKLTKCGGYYMFNRRQNKGIKIQLSNSILRLNPEQFVEEVIGHEAAHQIAHELHGLHVGHGRQWKSIMRIIGQVANRCHNMKTEPTTRGQRFTYVVGFETLELGPVRHRHIQNGTRSYSVRGCGKILASHWVNNQLIDEPLVKRTAPKANKAESKADKVRAEVRRLKGNGYSLEQVLNNSKIINVVANTANMKPGLAKTYIKNNWSKA